VNDILDMEKIQSGKLEFKMTRRNLSEMVQEAIENNQGISEQYDIQFMLDRLVGDAIVSVDEKRVHQVMANLLSNAAKFSPDRGIVKISLILHEDYYRVMIVDDGPGIPKEFRNQIFGRFEQADASDSRLKGGTGLGLNISKAIIEKHGGTIGFFSEEGEGTTFFFDLPKAD